MKKKKIQQPKISSDTKEPDAPKYNFDEIYKSVTHLLVNGTKEQQDKVWKMLN